MPTVQDSSKFLSWSFIGHSMFAIAVLLYQPAKEILNVDNIVVEIIEAKPHQQKILSPAKLHANDLIADNLKSTNTQPQKITAQASQQPTVDSIADELSSALDETRENMSTGSASQTAALDIPQLESIQASQIQTAHVNLSELVDESEFSVINSKTQSKIQKMGSGFDSNIIAASEESENASNAQTQALKNEAAQRGKYVQQRKSQIGNELGSALAKARTLDQLRQMPNNPKPVYSENERLQGHQGKIVFLAFINKAGNVSDFKLMKSTGYKNLDLKTFAALKKWKFYPGQEGWVELPYQWNLKGGTQEMPTLLRREISKK